MFGAVCGRVTEQAVRPFTFFGIRGFTSSAQGRAFGRVRLAEAFAGLDFTLFELGQFFVQIQMVEVDRVCLPRWRADRYGRGGCLDGCRFARFGRGDGRRLQGGRLPCFSALVQQLLTDAGITSQFSKPWQAARATCNERLEAVQEGVGQFVLGHSLGLNAKSYRQPSAIIRDAILRVPQPLSFQL